MNRPTAETFSETVPAEGSHSMWSVTSTALMAGPEYMRDMALLNTKTAATLGSQAVNAVWGLLRTMVFTGRQEGTMPQRSAYEQVLYGTSLLWRGDELVQIAPPKAGDATRLKTCYETLSSHDADLRFPPRVPEKMSIGDMGLTHSSLSEGAGSKQYRDLVATNSRGDIIAHAAYNVADGVAAAGLIVAPEYRKKDADDEESIASHMFRRVIAAAVLDKGVETVYVETVCGNAPMAVLMKRVMGGRGRFGGGFFDITRQVSEWRDSLGFQTREQLSHSIFPINTHERLTNR